MKKQTDSQRLHSLQQQQQATINPLISLNMNLDSLAEIGAASRAQELLRRIGALYQEGYYEVSPDVVSYNSVLKAWKEDDQPKQALELLEAMIEHNSQDEEQEHNGADVPASSLTLPSSTSLSLTSQVQVDVISFNTVIAAFANQGNYIKCTELLRRMQSDVRYPNPNTITYNVVLYSLAQSPDRGTAAQAETLLREMMTQDVAVDSTSFNTCIYAWSKETSVDHRVGSINKIDAEYSSHRSLNDISVFSACRASELLTIMEELSDAGNVNVHPDTFSYTTTIQAFARSRQPQQAQEIFHRMTSKTDLQPSRLTYTALMSAYAKSGQPERAHEILQDMTKAYQNGNIIELKPDTAAYSSVIDGWAKVASIDRPEAAKEALALFDIMKKKSNEGMRPNAQTYTSLLTVFAKCGTGEWCEMAHTMLLDMEQMYYETSDETIRPTRFQYNAVLNAYAKSPIAEKALKAHRLFTDMKGHSRSDCHPDTISYNSLLEACSNAFGNPSLKERSFQIALEAFKAVMAEYVMAKNVDVNQMGDSRRISPTSTTFAQFAKVCRRLIPEPNKRKSALYETLQVCRKLGMMNHMVVRQVQMACQSEREWKETVKDLAEFVDWKADFRRCPQVPVAWTCCARR